MRRWLMLTFSLLVVAATACKPIVAVPPGEATSSPQPLSQLLHVYFFDVGQGDSILLKGPDFAILIDAGRHDRSDVVPHLEQVGVEAIDLMIGTHPHADHIGQFPEVLARFPVTEVWLSGDLNTSRTFEDTIDAIAESGAGYHEPRAGEVYEIGSARIEVLNPEHLTGEANEGSVSVRILFGDVAFMFTGDAEEPSERAIIAHGFDLKSQILKLGHHGSDTSSSPAFLEAVQPEVAIWSAGIDNTYGHPKAEVIERLQQMGVTVYGTAIHSTIIVTTDGKSYEVVPANESAATMPMVAAEATPTPEPSVCASGQINLNTASAGALDEIAEVGPARAQDIIESRPYASVDDLLRVEGIGEGTLAAIKEQGLACVE
jgi:beta-lactamase superfamily II metal-dependent hydrolase